MDDNFLGHVRAGNERAMATFRDTLEQLSLHQSELTQVWSVVIEGMHHATTSGDAQRLARLSNFAVWLGNVRQDDDVRIIYGDLGMIYGSRDPKQFSLAVTRTAASVAKVARGNAPGGETYLMLAKDALLQVLERGKAENRKSAAAGLAHIHDPGVRAKLTEIAQHGQDDELREAAGELVAVIRTALELNVVVSDMMDLLPIEYPDPNEGRREWLEQVLDAARVVLDASGREQDDGYAAAVKVLSVFGSSEDERAAYFHRGRERRVILPKMMVHVENALLRAIVKANDASVREEAGRGLEAIGSDRVEGILSKMAARTGEESEVGRLVTATLETVMMNNCEVMGVQTAPARPPPRPLPRRKRLASDPEKVLRVTMGPEKKSR